jgi:hypothetical protein
MAAIRDVCRLVNPDSPTEVTQDDFDDNRERAGHDDLPTARQIADRLNMSWRALLDVAFDKARHDGQALGRAQGDLGRKGITLDDCVRAVQLVARRLTVPSLDRSGYRDGRRTILKSDSQAWRHGGDGVKLLPTLDQIDYVVAREQERDETAENVAPDPASGSEAGKRERWNWLLERAGLEASGPDRSAPLEDMVARFAETFGYLPAGRNMLCTWVRDVCGERFRNVPSEAVQKAGRTLNRGRAAGGLKRLPAAPRGFDVRAGARPPAIPRRAPQKHDWDKDSFVAGLEKAIPHLGPGEHLTQRTVKRIARDHPGEGIPSYSTIYRRAPDLGTTFDELCEEAERNYARRAA